MTDTTRTRASTAHEQDGYETATGWRFCICGLSFREFSALNAHLRGDETKPEDR